MDNFEAPLPNVSEVPVVVDTDKPTGMYSYYCIIS